jgi:hypothetical protein
VTLTEFAPEIWTAEQALTVAPFMDLGARMTVIRLASGGLLLHSPVEWSEELDHAVSIHGPVRFIVAPNMLHHLFVGSWIKRYPDAVAIAAPGLADKKPSLRFHETFHSSYSPSWGEEISHESLKGAPKLNEVVLFHHPTKTLLVTDLLFFLPNATGVMALYGWLNQCRRQPAPTAVLRMMVKDAPAFSESIRRILAWQPHRLILSHGSCIDQDAGPAIAAGLKRWT